MFNTCLLILLIILNTSPVFANLAEKATYGFHFGDLVNMWKSVGLCGIYHIYDISYLKSTSFTCRFQLIKNLYILLKKLLVHILYWSSFFFRMYLYFFNMLLTSICSLKLLVIHPLACLKYTFLVWLITENLLLIGIERVYSLCLIFDLWKVYCLIKQ